MRVKLSAAGYSLNALVMEEASYWDSEASVPEEKEVVPGPDDVD